MTHKNVTSSKIPASATSNIAAMATPVTQATTWAVHNTNEGTRASTTIKPMAATRSRVASGRFNKTVTKGGTEVRGASSGGGATTEGDKYWVGGKGGVFRICEGGVLI